MKPGLLLLVSVLLFTGCSAVHKSDAPSGAGGDNARTSLDWDGTYRGVMPCADCSGIETTLTLKPDGTFVESMQYLGKSDVRVIDKGRFHWHSNGRDITLSNGEMYMVGENRVFRLDRNGKRVKGALADQYTLNKD